MAVSQNGRDVRIYMSDDGGTTYSLIAGALEDSASLQVEGIDGTDKDDAGNRTFIDDIGLKMMSMSCSGKMKSGNTDLEDWWAAAGAGSTLRKMKFERQNGKTYVADFIMPSFEPGATDKEAATFSASFESSGAVTVTDTA